MLTSGTMERFLRVGAAMLGAAGVDAPRREARLLLAHALGVEPSALLAIGRTEILEAPAFPALLDRRAAREPLAFLVGRQGFWTLDLAVSRDTLIPRGDSEALIEQLIRLRPSRAALRRMLDLGTGTGCLLLAALSEYPAAFGIGVDLSPGACLLAAGNALRNDLGDRAAFCCGSWDSALAGGGFDLVLSNPPYIPTPQLSGLMPEVVGFEPRRALDGGPDGLDAYRLLCGRLRHLLAPGGLAILEVGQGQARDVAALGERADLRLLDIACDLGGIERAVAFLAPETDR
ncbi:peptide chain release factor N(5)-glutamine methyltransferase [Rhizosaccharibacter radicis]|uniref:Release factor glutamine methyltransferase n=1 Tax=Rhizosaccharibacter radicis TaxID=2782605 RepID=A0ABT1VWG0_9PROT|nr:peptide chain release factor N(5)-glutamine methyltransferase [Acetobacteraceae bacterium KSS12]